MAAKQSKLWAYIIVFFLLVISGMLGYYFLSIKPEYKEKIEILTLERDYVKRLNDSILAAKSHSDTIWYENVTYDTVTFYAKTSVLSRQLSGKSRQTSSLLTKKLDTVMREYQGRYVTEHFDLPWKVRAVKFESLTFLPYTIRSSQITNHTIIDCPPCPKLECKDTWHLYGSVFTGYGTDAIFGANINYVHKKGWGVLAGYSTTITKHYGILGLSIKLK